MSIHFEILVEDQSGKKMLEILVPKIIDVDKCSFTIISYKGIGHIPKNLKPKTDAKKRILLDRLPSLLRGYGKTFAAYPEGYKAVVIVVTDLDNKCFKEFKSELTNILKKCKPEPETSFCIAIEEGEAWLLGDINAVTKKFFKAKKSVLKTYVNDSICGTWELLADSVYSGGSQQLSGRGWQAVGSEKFLWAEEIAPEMNVENNNSPSFCYFRDNLRSLERKFTS